MMDINSDLLYTKVNNQKNCVAGVELVRRCGVVVKAHDYRSRRTEFEYR